MKRLAGAPIYVGKGPLPRDLCSGRVFVVVDAGLPELYGNRWAEALGGELVWIPGGEKGKTEEGAAALIDELCTRGAGRDSCLVALGGGATTDLVGFVASIYLRGVALILAPTTLLAMVDAAIGGKTAINTPWGKNLIGTLYPPQVVWADLEALETLPQKEWLNGCAEILKIGLVLDASLSGRVGQKGEAQEGILRAIERKLDVVEQDPTEMSLRRVLNFGHTIGHALETVSRYEMSHGEAVALGCVAEAFLSCALGYLSKGDFAAIEAMYTAFSCRLPKGYTRQELWKAMGQDKKRAEGQVRFVLLDRIGHAMPFDGAYCRAVGEKELLSTLDWMERRYG